MAIPSVAVENYATGTDQSISVTLAQQSGSNRVVVIIAGLGGYTPGVTGSPAYSGVTPTAAWAADTYQDGNYVEIVAYIIKEADLPADGTNTFTLSLTDPGWFCQISQIDNVDQTSPINVHDGGIHFLSANPSQTITTTVADCLLLAEYICYDVRTFTVDSPGTLVNQADTIVASLGGAVSITQDAASSTEHTVALTYVSGGANARDTFAILAIAPAAAAASSLLLLSNHLNGGLR